MDLGVDLVDLGADLRVDLVDLADLGADFMDLGADLVDLGADFVRKGIVRKGGSAYGSCAIFEQARWTLQKQA